MNPVARLLASGAWRLPEPGIGDAGERCNCVMPQALSSTNNGRAYPQRPAAAMADDGTNISTNPDPETARGRGGLRAPSRSSSFNVSFREVQRRQSASISDILEVSTATAMSQPCTGSSSSC